MAKGDCTCVKTEAYIKEMMDTSNTYAKDDDQSLCVSWPYIIIIIYIYIYIYIYMACHCAKLILENENENENENEHQLCL